jgi:DNA repair and recombination RAD54-like protein
MLEHIRNHTTDKIVLISNATQTLDLMEKLCRNKKWVNTACLLDLHADGPSGTVASDWTEP